MQIFQTLAEWYMSHMNYATVALLMTVESSFIPFPSEIVVPPAAWKAAQGEMHWAGVFLAANMGALCGALINYFLALKLGRKVCYKLAETRLAHAMLINAEGLEKAEAFFRKYGRSSTLVGRLVPAIRQLISIPAGLSRMNLKTFLLYTFLGATVWNAVLVALGYFLYAQKEILEQYYSHLSIAMAVLGALFIGYLAWNGLRKQKRSTTAI